MPKCSLLDNLPNLTINLDGDNYVLTPHEYYIKKSLFGFNICVLGIEGLDAPIDFILLGDVFLKEYYTHFDF
jgi:hypothetical protein